MFSRKCGSYAFCDDRYADSQLPYDCSKLQPLCNKSRVWCKVKDSNVAGEDMLDSVCPCSPFAIGTSILKPNPFYVANNNCNKGSIRQAVSMIIIDNPLYPQVCQESSKKRKRNKKGNKTWFSFIFDETKRRKNCNKKCKAKNTANSQEKCETSSPEVQNISYPTENPRKKQCNVKKIEECQRSNKVHASVQTMTTIDDDQESMSLKGLDKTSFEITIRPIIYNTSIKEKVKQFDNCIKSSTNETNNCRANQVRVCRCYPSKNSVSRSNTEQTVKTCRPPFRNQALLENEPHKFIPNQNCVIKEEKNIYVNQNGNYFNGRESQPSDLSNKSQNHRRTFKENSGIFRNRKSNYMNCRESETPDFSNKSKNQRHNFKESADIFRTRKVNYANDRESETSDISNKISKNQRCTFKENSDIYGTPNGYYINDRESETSVNSNKRKKERPIFVPFLQRGQKFEPQPKKKQQEEKDTTKITEPYPELLEFTEFSYMPYCKMCEQNSTTAYVPHESHEQNSATQTECRTNRNYERGAAREFNSRQRHDRLKSGRNYVDDDDESESTSSLDEQQPNQKIKNYYIYLNSEKNKLRIKSGNDISSCSAQGGSSKTAKNCKHSQPKAICKCFSYPLPLTPIARQNPIEDLKQELKESLRAAHCCRPLCMSDSYNSYCQPITTNTCWDATPTNCTGICFPECQQYSQTNCYNGWNWHPQYFSPFNAPCYNCCCSSSLEIPPCMCACNQPADECPNCANADNGVKKCPNCGVTKEEEKPHSESVTKSSSTATNKKSESNHKSKEKK